MKIPDAALPASALDDRLGWVGTSGSGKTYNAGGGVEQLLHAGARVVIVDPLDVWYGLRLLADGKTPSPYPVVIFGGAHADLPVNEHAGALIGETVAGMAESCIVSLGGFTTKTAERRFMLAFLESLYRKANGEPFHVIFDEADLWAPQKADEPMLQSLMEQIVRRGRVKGFIPWLITQRPAVISKDVLSQVDGLIAFKLTSSQDRDALEGWIEGQADKQEWKVIRAKLPTMDRGVGVVWIPGRGLLETKSFPPKLTFDSSRTPKRGEKKRATTALTPLDLPALKERLATVEAETKANDPKLLRAENAKLGKRIVELERAAAAPRELAIDVESLARERAAGRSEGQHEAAAAFVERLGAVRESINRRIDALVVAVTGQPEGSIDGADISARNLPAPAVRIAVAADKYPASANTNRDSVHHITHNAHKPAKTYASAPRAQPRPQSAAPSEGVSRSQQRILEALATLGSMGIAQPGRTQLALWAEVSPTSGGYFNNLGALRTAGLIDYPSGGAVALTEIGRARAPAPAAPSVEEIQESLCIKVGNAKAAILRALIDAYPRDLTRDALAGKVGVSNTSGGYFNNLGALRTLGVIDYPSPGRVVALPVLFLE